MRKTPVISDQYGENPKPKILFSYQNWKIQSVLSLVIKGSVWSCLFSGIYKLICFMDYKITGTNYQTHNTHFCPFRPFWFSALMGATWNRHLLKPVAEPLAQFGLHFWRLFQLLSMKTFSRMEVRGTSWNPSQSANSQRINYTFVTNI